MASLSISQQDIIAIITNTTHKPIILIIKASRYDGAIGTVNKIN
ncbi:hypothetical protein PROVRUST_07973 [Providencia rustigianii DSM 4541]|uniref:Uncharacterized protein n=1 Tax=Providencia rustigianii DSM 4541 TaxID=500637 RepID=D1P6V3_9GAMM|nr:hypothetical protein PROVRUST_07973 [Providencia rustigianii DSM 4541]